MKLLIGRGVDHYRGLDYGGGNGAYTELLSEHNIVFKSHDPYDFSNVDFDTGKSFNIISCFEVLEHTTTPIDTMLDMISFSSDEAVFVMSTQLSDKFCNDKTRCEWTYIGPRNGHVSIYSRKSIAFLAKKFGFYARTVGNGLHIFGKKEHVKKFQRRAILFKIWARLRRIFG